MASIIERIDLGYASNLMRVLIKLTAPSGLLSQMGMDDRLKGEGAPRLGPRPFSISLENSFGDNFVLMYISIHASISS